MQYIYQKIFRILIVGDSLNMLEKIYIIHLNENNNENMKTKKYVGIVIKHRPNKKI